LITFPAVAIASFPKSSNTESQINPLQDPNLTTDETNQSKPKRTCEDPGDESPDYILVALKEEEMRNDGKEGAVSPPSCAANHGAASETGAAASTWTGT
jgi:hypothetical protein